MTWKYYYSEDNVIFFSWKPILPVFTASRTSCLWLIAICFSQWTILNCLHGLLKSKTQELVIAHHASHVQLPICEDYKYCVVKTIIFSGFYILKSVCIISKTDVEEHEVT